MKNEMDVLRPGSVLMHLSVDELGERAAALARDIDFSANRMLTDMVSMGEIFAHVKSRTEFGRYGNYMRFVEATGVSKRMAQYSVQAYQRFAENPAVLARIGGVSKLIEVLALPEGEESAFLETHDVAQMSVSEVRRAVKAAKAGDEETDVQTPAKKEEADTRTTELEKRCRELEQANRFLREEGEKSLAALADSQRKADALQGLLQDSKEARRKIEDDLSSLRRQMERAESQTTRKAIQMDGAAFNAAVRKFLADCCEVPQMGKCFYDMKMSERLEFNRGMDMLDGFMTSVRSAMNTVDVGEVSVR